MSTNAFSTAYAKSNQETLRWASVAIAGFLAVVVLIFAGVIASKESFRSRIGGMDATERAFRALGIAFMFLVTVAATFLSWYLAALHLGKNYLIALDVLNFVIVVFLGFAAYFFYRKESPKPGYAVGFLLACMILELVALIVLIAGPQAAGASGTVTQSALYVPLFISTLGLMGAINISSLAEPLTG